MASRRQQIWARAGGRCEYCLLAQDDTTLPHEVDHIRARKHRGPTTLANTCLACAYCNAAKGTNAAGYDPGNRRVGPALQPARRRLGRSLRMGRSILMGRTPVGRATVEVLGINRPERIEHRRLLAEARGDDKE